MYTVAPSPIVVDTIQDLIYTYDKVGNITRIVDASMTANAKAIDYLYDGLYRLVSASTTNATTTNYVQTLDYSPIGNIENKSDVGVYAHLGNTGSLYANPHAVTDIAGKSYTYDNNGNLLNNQSWAFSWDYMNRLTQTSSSTATSTYKYDHTTQRVRLDDGSQTTHYPNKYYNATYPSPFPTPSPSPSPSPTPVSKSKHVFANNKTIATVDGTGLSVPPKSFLNHNDHLGGSNVLSDQYGRLEQLLDYYPFGSVRIDQRGENSFNEQRKFSGHEHDSQTSLSYMGARYYPGKEARFLSQDPAFLAVGDPRFEEITSMKLQRVLRAPQLLNAYTYGVNNPLRVIDPDGQWFKEFLTGKQSGSDFQIEVGQAAQYLYDNNSIAKAAMDHPVATGVVVGVGSGLAAYGASAGITGLLTQLGIIGGSQADKIQQASNSGLSVGQSFGKLGTVIENTSGKVTGFTQHGFEQAAARGVSTETILQTTKNPLAVLQQAGNTRLFLSEKAAVVLNKAGQVVTTYGSNLFKPEVQNIINKATEK